MTRKQWAAIVKWARDHYVSENRSYAADAKAKGAKAETFKLRAAFDAAWPIQHGPWLSLPQCLVRQGNLPAGKPCQNENIDAEIAAYLRDYVTCDHTTTFQPTIPLVRDTSKTLRWRANPEVMLRRSASAPPGRIDYTAVDARLWPTLAACDAIYLGQDHECSPIIGRVQGATVAIVMPIRLDASDIIEVKP